MPNIKLMPNCFKLSHSRFIKKGLIKFLMSYLNTFIFPASRFGDSANSV